MTILGCLLILWILLGVAVDILYTIATKGRDGSIMSHIHGVLVGPIVIFFLLLGKRPE